MSRVTPSFVALLLSAFSSASAQECVAPPAGVLAWYRGERNADDAAGVHNGTPLAEAGFVAGHVGEAFRFDGVDDGYGTDTTSTEQRAVRDTFTYEAWVKPSGPLGACAQSDGGACFGLAWAIFPTHGDVSAPADEGGQAAGMGLAVGTDGICVGAHTSFEVTCLARFATAIADWTHVVAVVEDKRPRIYVDGVLVHTGVPSQRAFVFASWQVIGTGLSLGRYAGDLDELTIYDRALADAEIASLFAAGTSGKCPTDCAMLADDAWQGAEVTAASAVRAGSRAGDAFGGLEGTPEPGNLLFEDGQPDGTVNHLEWELDTPISLRGFHLAALHDPVPAANRAARRVRLLGRNPGGTFATLYDSGLVVPYRRDGNALRQCVNLRPARLQQFRIELTQHGPAGFSGVRLEELDGIGQPDAVFRDGFELNPPPPSR